MARYIVRRLVLMVPVAFLVTLIAFGLLRLAPGDPVLMFAGEERDPETLNQIRRSLGRDLHGDFGRSLRTRQPVGEAIVERLPATIELGVAALSLSVSVALLVGTLSALKRNSPIDLLATG